MSVKNILDLYVSDGDVELLNRAMYVEMSVRESRTV